MIGFVHLEVPQQALVDEAEVVRRRAGRTRSPAGGGPASCGRADRGRRRRRRPVAGAGEDGDEDGRIVLARPATRRRGGRASRC